MYARCNPDLGAGAASRRAIDRVDGLAEKAPLLDLGCITSRKKGHSFVFISL
jgi:hypothetical protein